MTAFFWPLACREVLFKKKHQAKTFYFPLHPAFRLSSTRPPQGPPVFHFRPTGLRRAGGRAGGPWLMGGKKTFTDIYWARLSPNSNAATLATLLFCMERERISVRCGKLGARATAYLHTTVKKRMSDQRIGRIALWPTLSTEG